MTCRRLFATRRLSLARQQHWRRCVFLCLRPSLCQQRRQHRGPSDLDDDVDAQGGQCLGAAVDCDWSARRLTVPVHPIQSLIRIHHVAGEAAHQADCRRGECDAVQRRLGGVAPGRGKPQPVLQTEHAGGLCCRDLACALPNHQARPDADARPQCGERARESVGCGAAPTPDRSGPPRRRDCRTSHRAATPPDPPRAPHRNG